MSNSSEYPQAPGYMLEMVNTILKNEALNGVSFSNIVLSAPGISDAYEPNMSIDHQSIISVWPGGSPAGNGYESTILRNSFYEVTEAEEVQFQRQTLLQANVGKVALERVPQEMKALWTKPRPSGMPAVRFAQARAVLSETPLGLVLAGTVHESTVANQGKRTMHLFYPLDIRPQSILVAMRMELKKVIQEETL